MHTRLARSVVGAALAASALLSACSKDASTPAAPAAPQAGAAQMAPDTVVATYGDQKITYAQLTERLGDDLQTFDQKYQKDRHTMLERGLEGMVTENLVNAEAKKRGQTQEQFLKAEIEDKVPAPTDAEIKQVFDGAKASGRVPEGMTLDANVKQQIAASLTRPKQQEVAQALFAKLRQDANVKLSLPKPAVQRKQVAAEGPSKGPASAPVTIVEFSDFECPFCSRAEESVTQVLKEYGDKVRIVYRQFPLEMHANAQKAAEASLCANDQGKFWELHKVLFENQSALKVDDLKKHAATVGLDAKKFAECLDSGSKAAQVKKDLEDGQKVGVNGTPAFFVNGIFLNGAVPFAEFKKVIDDELAKK